MKQRFSNPSLGDMQLNMVFHHSGRAPIFGPGSYDSVGHQNVLHAFSLVIGVAAVASTLLLGSFLWGLVFRKNKKKNKEQDVSASFADLYLHAIHKPNTVAALHDKPAPSPSPQVPDTVKEPAEIRTTLFDSLASDSGQDYAQVLAEARFHAAATQRALITTPKRKFPGKQSSNKPKHGWLTRSSSARAHNRFSDVEAVFPLDDPRIKSSKSWKRLLFWKKSKRSNLFEFNTRTVSHSNGTTPLHYLFKSSKTRATVTPATPSMSTTRNKPERARSGPLYNDGSAYTYSRTGRASSGPLSASATPTRDDIIGSPYFPLKKPAMSPRISPGPLYVP